jgi:hypothetical protein
MNTFKAMVLASVIGLGAVSGSALSQEAPATQAETNSVAAAPSWQAVCGYKWRMHRIETGDAGRDAYLAFMRKPSAEGGCGAGETTRARPVQVRPQDAAIKAYLDAHPATPAKVN